MSRFIFIAVFSALITSPIYASEEPVDEFFRVMSMEKQMLGGFEAMMPMINQMANRFQLNPAQTEELKNIFRTWFKEDMDHASVMKKMKVMYQERFTSEELQAVTAFFKTPEGKKFIDASPELMKIGAQIGMQEAQSKEYLLMERIKPFLEKQGIRPRQ